MGTILVNILQLRDEHRASIEAAAAARGWNVRFCDDQASALSAAEDAEIIFGPDAALLPVAKRLKWLCVPSAGVDPYIAPVRACEGVMLSNSSGAYGVTIAEHVTMVTLEMMRRQPEYQALMRQHGWRRDLPIRSIRDSRVTLLGTGDIGREVALRFRAFGPRSITGVNRRGKNPGDMFDAVRAVAELDQVLCETDLLVMSLPGTSDTRHILDVRRMNLLPDDAFIVNVGRGSAIDAGALERQLRAGRFYGAALDVFEQEPLDPESTLWECPRLLLTPHVAGNMTLPYTVTKIVRLFIEDFENYCEGRPLNRRVALDQGY